MHDREKSDRLVVPAKLPNKPAQVGAEVVEGRGLPEGNTASETRPGLSAGESVSSELDRVRQVARKDREVRFTALLHHVTIDRLREAYRAISSNASERFTASAGRWVVRRARCRARQRAAGPPECAAVDPMLTGRCRV
jgi:hypothetical protein